MNPRSSSGSAPETPRSSAEAGAGRASGGATKKSGFVAVIGAPNAGKSTLVNALVGSKVSIVTQKVQTTRFPVRGVVMEGDAQIVLVDTPGIFKPRRRLDRAMVRAAQGQAQDADVVVHLVDAEGELTSTPAALRSAEDTAAITEGLVASGKKAILALNKIDQVKRDSLLALAHRLFETGAYDEVFMISAKTGSGLDDLRKRLAERMPPGEWFYPADQAADLPVRLLAAEITREKLYLRVHEEVPYALAVETDAFEPRQDGSVRIQQTIYVERESQRPIVLGKGGQTIKAIGKAAREELALILDQLVHLFLEVKVREGWQDDRRFYSEIGLDYDV